MRRLIGLIALALFEQNPLYRPIDYKSQIVLMMFRQIKRDFREIGTAIFQQLDFPLFGNII